MHVVFDTIMIHSWDFSIYHSLPFLVNLNQSSKLCSNQIQPNILILTSAPKKKI